ncbi:MAG: UTP--glucose-1-phosphate uridylyltransferase [Phycisphaerales bacterium]|nr:UTP--glucose-1-phosphate uridylyltransferase [Phycisphaerales bacterium]
MGLTFDSCSTLLASVGQQHLLRFWNRLDSQKQTQLLRDIAQVNLPLIAQLVRENAAGSASQVHPPSSIEPAPTLPDLWSAGAEHDYPRARADGERHIRQNKVAAMIVAGGQGTRLGFDAPKGMFPISPIRRATLFQWFAEALIGARRRFNAAIPWYVMTSPVNDQATRRTFAEQRFFGLGEDTVRFFAQGVMPAVSTDGKILLESEHRLALSPDGHGGSLTALARSGCLEDMKRRGIETLSYFQVDNPLARPVDPLLIGLHLRERAEVSSLTIGKADDLERVGNFVRIGDRNHVIEYTELPEALARRRDAQGRRLFDAANLSIFVFSLPFLERITGAGDELPWHRALKKVPCLDPITGERLEPAAPNAIKFERFVFDALPLASRSLLVRGRREECFSPVKNASGTDSAEQARRDLCLRGARWLETCGVRVDRSPDGAPAHPVEISPALAADAEELREALRTLPPPDLSGPVLLCAS